MLKNTVLSVSLVLGLLGCNAADTGIASGSAIQASTDTSSSSGGAQTLFSGGSGTAQDPYRITTTADLQGVWLYPTADYQLMNDIDYANAVNIQRIGANGTALTFSGVFDGNGFTIKNKQVHWTSGNGGTGDYMGLFAINTGTIKNLTTYNVTIVGHNNVGVLVGENQGTILNCAITYSGSSGNDSVGGMAGSAVTGSITGATYTNVTVFGNSHTGQSAGLFF